MRNSIARLVLAVIAVWTVSASVAASQANPQDGKPSTPALPYVVMPHQSVDDAVKELRTENKIKNLIGGDAIGCRVFIQHEKDVTTNQAEIHDAADDVFLILDGNAVLTLGGTLESPRQISRGEWRASNILGGTDIRLAAGDLVIVPRGTAHKRTSAGQDVTLLIFKASTPAAR